MHKTQRNLIERNPAKTRKTNKSHENLDHNRYQHPPPILHPTTASFPFLSLSFSKTRNVRSSRPHSLFNPPPLTAPQTYDYLYLLLPLPSSSLSNTPIPQKPKARFHKNPPIPKTSSIKPEYTPFFIPDTSAKYTSLYTPYKNSFFF